MHAAAGPAAGQPVPNVQVRDVALVVMLHLTGQKPADYGYLHARLQPQQMFHVRTLHAANDQVRADAVGQMEGLAGDGRRAKSRGRGSRARRKR